LSSARSRRERTAAPRAWRASRSSSSIRQASNRPPWEERGRTGYLCRPSPRRWTRRSRLRASPALSQPAQQLGCAVCIGDGGGEAAQDAVRELRLEAHNLAIVAFQSWPVASALLATSMTSCSGQRLAGRRSFMPTANPPATLWRSTTRPPPSCRKL